METVQFRITCPKCGNSSFTPDNATPQDLVDGKVACGACGRPLTAQDVEQLKADILASRGPQDATSAAVAEALRGILR